MADLSTQIKNALKKAGLDEDLAEQIKVEKEEDINKAVDELKKDIEGLKSLSGEDFTIAVEKAGLSDALKKYVASEADRRVTEAIKTHDDKLHKELDEVKTKVALEKEKEGLSEDQKKLVTLTDSVEKLTGLFEKLIQKNSEKDITDEVIRSMKEVRMNEGFAEFINVKSVEEVGDAVKHLSEKVLGEQQQVLDKKLEELGVPASGTEKTSTQLEVQIANYAKKKGQKTDEGGLMTSQIKKTEKE